MANRWSKKDELTLIQGIGVYGTEWFKKNCGDSYDWPTAPKGRSGEGCRQKAIQLTGTGLRRGAYSVREIVIKTGYSRSQIRRAMKALGQKWKRLSPRGPYIVYEEQYLDLIAWLAVGYWSDLHRRYNCIWCNGTKVPHEGKALCLTCYRRYTKRLQRLGLPTSNRELKDLLRERAPDILQIAEKNLDRKRALPEHLIEPCERCGKLFLGPLPVCVECIKEGVEC